MKINWGFGPPKDDDGKSGQDAGKPGEKPSKSAKPAKAGKPAKKNSEKTTGKGLAKGFGKAMPNRRAGDDPADAGDDTGNGSGSEIHGWTAGASMATNGITWALRGALIAGPLALMMHLLMPSGDAVVQQSDEGDRVGESAAVGEFAQQAIVAWLETPRDQSDVLSEYFGEVPRARPEIPWTTSDAEVAEIVRDENGLWSVVVGVDAAEGKPKEKPGQQAEPAPSSSDTGENSDGGEDSSAEDGQPDSDAVERITSGRLYFTVPVLYVEGEMIAQALPAPTSAPESVDQLETTYEHELSGEHPAYARVTNFLTAMLINGDQAELEAYSNPGTSFDVLNPSPYADLTVESITATDDDNAAIGDDAEQEPEDGDVLDITVKVILYGSNGQQIGAQYSLLLQARENRWEVAEIRMSPELAEPVPVPTATPTPTETTTTPPSTSDTDGADTESPSSTDDPTSESAQ